MAEQQDFYRQINETYFAAPACRPHLAVPPAPTFWDNTDMTPEQFIACWKEKPVADVYGWIDHSPEMPDEEILKRLLALNLERSGGANER